MGGGPQKAGTLGLALRGAGGLGPHLAQESRSSRKGLRRLSSWTRSLSRDLSPQDRPAQGNGTKRGLSSEKPGPAPPPPPALSTVGGCAPWWGWGEEPGCLNLGRSALSPTAQLSVPSDPATPLLGKHVHRHTSRMTETTCVHDYHRMNKQSQVSTMEITPCHAPALGVLAPVPSSAPSMTIPGAAGVGGGGEMPGGGLSGEVPGGDS